MAGGGDSVDGRTVVRSRRRIAPVVAALVALVAIGAGAITFVTGLGGSDGDRSSDRADAPASPAPSSPLRAFPQASRRLETAGTFTYRGTVHAEAASLVRPGPRLADDVTVQGEVSLPDRTHEVASDDSGRSAETVTSGFTLWSRTAERRADLADEKFKAVDAFVELGRQVSSGPALLPRLLGLTSDRRAGEPDSEGRPTFSATLLADPLGTPEGSDEIVGLGGAEVVLTLDDSGDPVRIEIGPDGDEALRLAFDLADIGEPLTIDVPTGDEPRSARGPVTASEVVAAGISRPVELDLVPNDWILYDMYLAQPSPGADCLALSLTYQRADADPWDDVDFLVLDVTAPDCPAGEGPYPERIGGAGFEGTVDAGEFGTWAEVTDGQTTVQVFTDLSRPDLAQLLESLVPFDPHHPTGTRPRAAVLVTAGRAATMGP